MGVMSMRADTPTRGAVLPRNYYEKRPVILPENRECPRTLPLSRVCKGERALRKWDGQGVPRTLTDRSTTVNEGNSHGLKAVRGDETEKVK
jgi:hypothetical protein